MKGRIALLDTLGGRPAAALMVDGRLEDLLIDPPEGAAPAPGAIFRAVAARPMKGQGGLTVDLGTGQAGYLRHAKGIAPGTRLIVEVTGVAEASKAVPVSTRPLFKSRYAIVTPTAPGVNLSRQIRDEDTRDRLLEIAHAAMGENAAGHGLILRSAAEGADDAIIADDIATMRDLALAVMQDTDGAPECLLAAPDAHERAWREWSTPAPDTVDDRAGAFADHGVLEAVAALLTPQIPLAGGGSAWIEPTRALVAVDVNTGGDTSPAAGLKANIALARDLPRQLRLRGLGGQIVLDLAPMPKKERRSLEQVLGRAFRQDGAEVVVAGWTPLGHLELQRKRDRLPLSTLVGDAALF